MSDRLQEPAQHSLCAFEHLCTELLWVSQAALGPEWSGHSILLLRIEGKGLKHFVSGCCFTTMFSGMCVLVCFSQKPGGFCAHAHDASSSEPVRKVVVALTQPGVLV